MIPISFGRYWLVECLAVGGMAEVFKAKSFGAAGFERLVAIKRMLPTVMEDRDLVRRFADDAHLAARLNHPNIVQVYELGEQRNELYLVMEYVGGQDLGRILRHMRTRQRSLPLPAVAFIGCQVCEALAYAHSFASYNGQPLGLVHRDLGPQNVLIGYEGAVKVADFGGDLHGKSTYMSPEQARDEAVDSRSDVFSVGILLWEMSTGQPMFRGSRDKAAFESICNAEFASPRAMNAAIPAELQAVILKALEQNPDDRYPSAEALLDALAHFVHYDRHVFTGRRLAAWMHNEFALALDEEMANNEGYRRWRPT